MVKRFGWVQEKDGTWTLYRYRRDNGRELWHPRSEGYHIHTLGNKVILTFPDGGTDCLNSITEAKAEAEKDVAKEVSCPK